MLGRHFAFKTKIVYSECAFVFKHIYIGAYVPKNHILQIKKIVVLRTL